MNYTYILECRDGSFYTGWTNNLKKRLRSHNEGRGSKYTKARRPVRLVYYESYGTKQEAMRREYQIKRMTRRQKEKLLAAEASSGCSLRQDAAGAQGLLAAEEE